MEKRLAAKASIYKGFSDDRGDVGKKNGSEGGIRTPDTRIMI
jgi:hypothetical protein